MQLQPWLLLPALVAATTTTTVTQTRDCSDADPGTDSASASLQSGGSSTITVPPQCSTTDCASAGAAVPTCAQSCIGSVASALGCDDGDAICSCDNMPFIQTAAQPCVQTACPAEQYVPVTQSVQGLCSCASALSADNSCIASASAAAASRSRTRNSKSTSKSTPVAQTGEETSSTDIGSVSSDTALQSATQSDSQPQSNSQSESATQSDVQSGSQSDANSKSQSNTKSQSDSQSTDDNSASATATGTKEQTSRTTTDKSNTVTGTGTGVDTGTVTVTGGQSTTSLSTGTGAASQTTISVTGQRKAYSACPFTTTLQGSTIPATAVASGATTYAYLGCYQDTLADRAVSGSGYSFADHGVDECGAFCYGKGASFFAVEYHGECFCGTDLNDAYGCADTCNLNCDDEPNRLCGGDTAAQVYYLPDNI